MSKIIDNSYFTDHEDQSLKPRPTIAVHMPYHAHISVDIKDDWVVGRNGHQGWEAVRTFRTLGEAKNYLDYCNSPDIPFDHQCWKSTDISWVKIENPALTVSHQSVVQEPESVSEEKMDEIREHSGSQPDTRPFDPDDYKVTVTRSDGTSEVFNDIDSFYASHAGRLMALATRLEAMGEEIRQMILEPESGRYFSDIHTYKEGE